MVFFTIKKVVGHYSNWEILPQELGYQYKPKAVLYIPGNNRFLIYMMNLYVMFYFQPDKVDPRQPLVLRMDYQLVETPGMPIISE